MMQRLDQDTKQSIVIGNTPLHLAMESAHAEVAVLLIEAGADRDRVKQVSPLNLLIH